jgi:ABC-type molybdate transport system substrate-binding protein
MVLLKSASAQASEFYAFLQTQAARAILRRYGFAFD